MRIIAENEYKASVIRAETKILQAKLTADGESEAKLTEVTAGG